MLAKGYVCESHVIEDPIGMVGAATGKAGAQVPTIINGHHFTVEAISPLAVSEPASPTATMHSASAAQFSQAVHTFIHVVIT